MSNFGMYGSGGGGGFMGGSGGVGGGGAGYMTSTKTEGAGNANFESVRKIHPVTIKQLLDAHQTHPDDTFRVNGNQLPQMTLVAIIKKVEALSTNINFTIDDFTGSIDMKIWVDADDSDFKAQQRMLWTEGTMVRVHGLLKSTMGGRTVVAHHIRPVEDFNEFTFHRLEVIQVHLHETQGKVEPKAISGHAPMDTSTAGVFGAYGTVPPASEALAKFVKAHPTDPTGVPREEMIRALTGSFNPQQVNQAIDYLHQEGHLYSTIDDQHFSWCGS